MPSVALQILKDSQHEEDSVEPECKPWCSEKFSALGKSAAAAKDNVAALPLEGFFSSDTNNDLFEAVAACLPAPFQVFAGSAAELEGSHDKNHPEFDQGYVQVNFNIVGPPGTPLPDIDSECLTAHMDSMLEQEPGYDPVHGAYVMPVKVAKVMSPQAGEERNEIEAALKTVLKGTQSNAQGQTLAKLGRGFTPVGEMQANFKFMGNDFSYLPEAKRADLYGYNPKKDAELGADDNVLGNVPFLLAYGNKTVNKENAPYGGTFPAPFESYLATKTIKKESAPYQEKFPAHFKYHSR